MLVITGAVQRANPLPPGRYWIDVFDDNIPIFDQWSLAFSQAGLIRVEATEHFDAKPYLPPFQDSQPERNWILFRVIAPTPFDQLRFGFPTIATPDIDDSSDTVQRPEPEQPFNIGRALILTGLTIGGFLILSSYLSTRRFSRTVKALRG